MAKTERGQRKFTRKVTSPRKTSKTDELSTETPSNPKQVRSNDNFFIKSGKSQFGQSRQFQKNKKTSKLKPSSGESGDSFFIKSSESGDTQNSTRSAGPSDSNSPKKEFNKKLWRLQKYSKKFKVQQWEEKRRKSAFHKYQKELKHEKAAGVSLDVAKIYESEFGDATENKEKTLKTKGLKGALNEYDRLKEEKKRKREIIEKVKAEKKRAIEESKKRKIEKNKKLNKKTKRGQPVMKDRIEMLLEKIEKSLQ